MMQGKTTVIGLLTMTAFLAACNSPMPPDRGATAASNVTAAANGANGASAAPDSKDVIGANHAIATLALPPAKPLAPNPDYARFPRYVGTVGDKQIEMRLGAKTDEPSGVHGEYRFAGSASVILVAGDRDGDTLEIEESNDGTHITGNWVGKFAADGSVSGERMDADDSNAQPFDLKPAGGVAQVPANRAAKPAAKPAAPSLEPAPSAPPRNAVGGTSNVTIGE